MIFEETKLKGSFIISIEKIKDERGFFARSFCQKEFENNNLISKFVQCNISFNKKKGTLRGLHYQKEPCEEAKLIRCTKGKIFDVIVDIRKESKTYMQWTYIELSESNYKMLYVPKGFAHGFQTLKNDSEVFYQMSEFYNPNKSRGLRWDNQEASIAWPIEDKVISEKDLLLPEKI